MEKVSIYSKESTVTYTLGAYPTIELIETAPHLVRQVLYRSDYTEIPALHERCQAAKIPCVESDKTLHRIARKGNEYVAGVFDKFPSGIRDENHIVLVDVRDMGNLGTILRTMVGFGFRDLVLIGNCCDLFHPRTVRSSMGALFQVRYALYSDFQTYAAEFSRPMFPFLLDRERSLPLTSVRPPKRYSLIFGNEGAGLPVSFVDIGQPIFISQTRDIDSLNLPVAAGIGMHHFAVGGSKEERIESNRI